MKPFENNVGKGENVNNQQFLPSPNCFQPDLKVKTHFNFFITFTLSSRNPFHLIQSKMLTVVWERVYVYISSSDL